MANNKEFKKRIDSEARAGMPIKNENLICKDCAFMIDDTIKFGNVSRCEIYDSKPNEVFTKDVCEHYTKD